MKKTIVVVGAGKGLGNHVAEKFGRNDFRVILMARGRASLEAYQKEFEDKGIETCIYTADAADPASLTAAFASIKTRFGVPDVLFYNVGITSPDSDRTVDSTLLMKRYQIDVASAYHCIQQVLSEEFSEKEGTVLLTGGGLSLNPEAAYTPLSMDKAALRAMAQILHKELKEQGVFVGTVMVCGAIRPDTHFAPELIADCFWTLYKERNEFEIIYR